MGEVCPCETIRSTVTWAAETRRPIRGWQTDSVITSRPTFSPDGRTSLVGCESGVARFWDTATGNPVGEPLPNQGHALCAAYSPDGRTVLTGAKSGTAQLWDAASGRPIGPPLAHPLEVWGAAFSPDGRVVATCCHDGRARFWEATSGRPIGPPLPHGNVLLTAAFSPDGRSLLTACWDGHATVWPVPGPVSGSAEQVRLRAELATGMRLDADGAVRMLAAAEWHERKASHDRITMSR